MSKVQLRIRDLRTGRTDLHEVPDVETAVGWLRARPPFVEVLGVQPEGITREEDATMRAALRPLDEAERDASRKLDEAADRAAELRAEEQRRKASEAERAHR
jgi:hypothetical protein